MFFFFNDTATTEIYTLSLHDALPIYRQAQLALAAPYLLEVRELPVVVGMMPEPLYSVREHRSPFVDLHDHSPGKLTQRCGRSEEHTSELQSRQYLVCRLLLEKKKKI